MKTHGDLIVQSNAPDKEAANGIRRLNSGFYLARSSPELIASFDHVINLAMRSNMSEEPCFYDVACGRDGEHRRGEDLCVHKNVLSRFLDRAQFLNGKTNYMWEVAPGKVESQFPQAKLIHNSWVVGITAKEDRMRRHGFLVYEAIDELCQYDKFGFPTV